MAKQLALIGFGEAASTFAAAGGWRSAAAYDIKTDDPVKRNAKLADYQRVEVNGCVSAAEALAAADLILSLVTADQALAAAEGCAGWVKPGSLWIDLNSVAPQTKQAAAAAVQQAGGRYVDGAIMSPVQPAALSAPLLLAGADAPGAVDALTPLGFTSARALPGAVGAASAVKMIRSVLVKGLEALTAECALAATSAGVLDEVMSSLDSSWREQSWRERADYNLDRMMVHGLRRSAEMDEVVKTLDGLGTGSAMSRATAERQREIGGLGLSPRQGLKAKVDLLLSRPAEKAA